MARKRTFLLRLDPAVYAALQRWAGDELRSMHGQIEYLLRRALVDAGRLPEASPSPEEPPAEREREEGSTS